MTLRINGLTVSVNDPIKQALHQAIKQTLGPFSSQLKDFSVVKKSIDARGKTVKLIFSVDVHVKDEHLIPETIAKRSKSLEKLEIPSGQTRLQHPPVIIGAGPSGLFAGYLLALHGFQPLLIDRGGDIDERVSAISDFMKTRLANPENNILFGLGGAGTFSDGKLTTSLNHYWLRNVLSILVSAGAPQEILIDAKPHIGTDVLRTVVTNLVNKIETLGGIVKTGVTLNNLSIQNQKLYALDTSIGTIPATAAILGIGHSARDTIEMLFKSKVAMSPKPFQMGIRAEHPQSWLNTLQYGKFAGHPNLGTADYKVTARIDKTPIFSFCMCPGGQTIPTVNEPNQLCINGMSNHARNSDFSSSGVVVTVKPTDFGGSSIAKCLSFIRTIEKNCFVAGNRNYDAPAQRLNDLKNGKLSKSLPKTSYPLGVQSCAIHRLLPDFVSKKIQAALPLFEKSLPGYLQSEAIALAPEARASSPIRIERNPQSRQSTTIDGLYPVGEGAGYAGGIMSCALDGMTTARTIINHYKPFT